MYNLCTIFSLSGSFCVFLFATFVLSSLRKSFVHGTFVLRTCLGSSRSLALQLVKDDFADTHCVRGNLYIFVLFDVL